MEPGTAQEIEARPGLQGEKKSVHTCSPSSSGEQNREKLETLGCPGFSLPARDKVGGLQPFETSVSPHVMWV